MFRRCPPGCARASGLLLTPPRAMRCEPAVRQHDCFFPPNRCYAHHLGTVSVAMASSRHPSPRPRCLPHSGTRIPCPPSGLRPQRFAHILRDSASRGAVLMCRSGPAPVSCFTLLPHACLPLSSADLAVADSPLFARRRPAGRAATRPVAGQRAGSFNSEPNDDAVRHFTKGSRARAAPVSYAQRWLCTSTFLTGLQHETADLLFQMRFGYRR